MSVFKQQVGRLGLSTVEVNPAVYLEMATKIMRAERTGRTHLLGFDQQKLDVAFGKYMRDNMGKQRRGEKRDPETLRKIAKNFLRQAADKDAKKNKAAPGAKPSDNAKRAANILGENGWDAAENALPDGLMDGQDTPDLFDVMDDSELANGLVEAAHDLGPTLAVGALLLANNVADVGVASCELLVEKYEGETGSDASKETCLMGLQQMMQTQREADAVQDKLELIATKEENPQLQAQLLQLARPDDVGEDAAAIDLFASEKVEMTVLQGGKFMEPPEPFHTSDMQIVHDKRSQYKNNPLYIDSNPAPPWEKRA